MDFTYKKSTCERYDIRWGGCGWAVFTIDENGGVFNCQSDYGNYSYSWPCHGRESFKHFILELARDKSYFLNKISDRTRFNYEKSLLSWKKTIIGLRKNGWCTRDEAREAWYFIHGLDEYFGSVDLVQMKIYESEEIMALCSGGQPWDLFDTIMEYPPGAWALAHEVMPMFAEILKKEIAGESVLVPA